MKKIWLAIALVAAIIAGVGAASAVGEGDTVKACYNRGGTLKLQVGDKCPKGWTPVEWSVSGPAGEPGAAGATGATCSGCSGAGWTCGPARRRRISSLCGERHRALRSGSRRRVRPLRRHLRRLPRHAPRPRGGSGLVAHRCHPPRSDPCSPGALQIDQIVLGTQLGSASVPLTERAATGAVIPEVLISLTEARDTRFALLQYTLQGVVVAGTRTVWEGGLPVEEVSLSFDRIEWAYTPQKDDGTAGTPIRFCFDVAAKRPADPDYVPQHRAGGQCDRDGDLVRSGASDLRRRQPPHGAA